MNSLPWATKKRAPEGEPPTAPSEPEDVADTGVTAEDAGEASTAASSSANTSTSTSTVLPLRPNLQRNTSAPSLPPPPNEPPPPPSQLQTQSDQPLDSLSLAQLKKYVSEFPRNDAAAAYDFVYEDTGPHAEEIDEWFVYGQFWQWVRLNGAQRIFEAGWEESSDGQEWNDADDSTRAKFVLATLGDVRDGGDVVRVHGIGRIMYLILGRWMDTAQMSPFANSDKAPEGQKVRSVATEGQLAAMREGVQLVAQLDGLPIIWQALQHALEALWTMDPTKNQQEGSQEAQDELMNLMTVMYITIQVVLDSGEDLADVHERLVGLNPNIAIFMLNSVAKIRWLEGVPTSMTQILLLFWKSILLVFGGMDAIAETKEALREAPSSQKGDTITASPLDYHTFRQEISSKYPSYVPPHLPIALESDDTSLLPPLPNHPTRNNGSTGIIPAPPNTQSGGASILHQPVHIATPAPSPPPSPAAGGKGGKKQNYQTNQNFPFMYPPLDASSNSAGGKGGAGLQESLVGRKWEGSDIPASILEAGELFSKRVRMTRAIRQLWAEREKFLKFERGFDTEPDEDIDELDLDALMEDANGEVDDDKLLAFIEKRNTKPRKLAEVDYGPDPDHLDPKIKHRLEDIEKFYDTTLPQLQSIVIVLMRVVLANVTAFITMPQRGQDGQPNHVRLNQNGAPFSRSQDGINGTGPQDSPEMSLDDLDQVRARELEGKALSGVILLLLKWFKISHILKFEYLCQLLLDSNYIPLVLKLFAHQDVQQVVDSKADRIDYSFFYFCNLRARGNADKPVEPTEIDGPDDESEDDAAPPPIKRKKSPPRPAAAIILPSVEQGTKPDNHAQARPEVDELGQPVNDLPKEPITDFSRRNFFSLINYLRILQKICKNKAHRNLLLVQYKSSNIIRKSLKVPQEELRLYTLKLFKNQVPYCGRKWRQSNMRVITAVYLHCRPELRDEWLAGSDVDAEVEEALPLEQALRSLTHWFNVKGHPDQMAPDVRDALKQEHDFFKRELEKLEITWADTANAQVDGGDGMWDGQPMGAAWG